MRRSKLLALLAIVVTPSFLWAQEPAKTTYPHRLTGQELAAHFYGTWTAKGVTSQQTQITLYNDSGGTVRIKSHSTARVPDGFGRRKVDLDKDQVCFEMSTTSWRGATNCYRLVETEPKAFVLRPAEKGMRFEYRR